MRNDVHLHVMRVYVVHVGYANHVPFNEEESYRISSLYVLEADVTEPVITRLARREREQLLEMRQVIRIELFKQVT